MRWFQIRLLVVVALLASSRAGAPSAQAGLQLPLGSPVGQAPLLGGLLASLSGDLLEVVALGQNTPVRVLVSGPLDQITAAIDRLGLPVVRRLDQHVVVLAAADDIERLRREPGVLALSGDLPVVSAMSVSDLAMASDQARRGGAAGLLGLQYYGGVTGRGVGVAIVDSGIEPHRALANKVVAGVSFVPGDSSAFDEFGHGTHIAGIIAGGGAAATGVSHEYEGGVAPGAHLINVRVLGADGTGRTSDVIAGLDWVIANRTRYEIRVVNLSLGHPVTEPSITDPLGAAVARAVGAGVVVVVSAGNHGKTADGQPVLGGITSPGNSPHALTVGALNTWGTVVRSDDTVTTYSSRGPTKFESAVKPDVVAPGNKIVSLEARSSYLSRAYPAQHVAGSGSNAYARMSGTSMAAAMVSGAAVLLLDAAPGLTPRQAKFAMQSGASFMANEGLVAAGAGSVNVWASRRMAADGPSDLLSTSAIGGAVVRSTGVSFWDPGTLIDRLYRAGGVRLLSALDLQFVWADPARLPPGRLNLLGLGNPVSLDNSNQIIWGDTSGSTPGQQIIWGDQLHDPSTGQQIIWGDSSTSEGYQIIWGDTCSGGCDH